MLTANTQESCAPLATRYAPPSYRLKSKLCSGRSGRPCGQQDHRHRSRVEFCLDRRRAIEIGNRDVARPRLAQPAFSPRYRRWSSACHRCDRGSPLAPLRSLEDRPRRRVAGALLRGWAAANLTSVGRILSGVLGQGEVREEATSPRDFSHRLSRALERLLVPGIIIPYRPRCGEVIHPILEFIALANHASMKVGTSDLFRRHDILGWAKTLWVIVLVVVPYIGVFAYLIFQGRGMTERNAQQAQEARQELRRVVGFSAADEIEKLDRLKKVGSISETEFVHLRAKLVQ
jgi:Phospholipase_D-nuclease N-terminal